MAAAVTAATEGDGASCLLLEKGPQETGNGNSAFAAGMVLWTNQRDNFLEYLKELRGEMDNTPDDVLASFADGVSENLDWLRSLPGFSEDEVTITEYYAEGTGDSCYPEHNELEHAYSIGRIRWNPSNESGNTQVTLFMNSVVNACGDAITRKTNAPVTALVQDPETKEILGCVYTNGSSSTYVKAAKGVIMCCGGFENNAQMKADYLSAPWARRIAGECNEGDGITMCARAGADMWHMNSCAGFWTSMSKIDSDLVPHAHAEGGGHHRRRERATFLHGLGRLQRRGRRSGLRAPSPICACTSAARHGHMQIGGEWPHLAHACARRGSSSDAGRPRGRRHPRRHHDGDHRRPDGRLGLYRRHHRKTSPATWACPPTS